MAGAAVLLVLDQLKNLLGLHGVGGVHDALPGAFLAALVSEGGLDPGPRPPRSGFGKHRSGARSCAAQEAARPAPPARPLVAVIGMAALTWGRLGLDQRGVVVVGEIPARSPSSPHLDTAQISQLASGVLAVALLGLLAAISMAKAIAALTHDSTST